MSVRFLSSSEKKKLLSDLKERYGLNKQDYLFVLAGKERIRAFSGTMSREEINALSEFARVETVGGYFARQEPFGLRLSFDMTQLLSHELKNNIVEFTRAQFVVWMKGEPVNFELEDGVYLVRYDGDFIGSGYCKSGKLHNYVPKERYMRKLV